MAEKINRVIYTILSVKALWELVLTLLVLRSHRSGIGLV